MASLKQIRTAAKDTIDANIEGLFVYRTVPDAANVPAAVVVPAETDFVRAMGRGTDTWELDVYILVADRESALAQDELDDYVTGAGDKSIRQVIFQNRTLGLPNTDAHISRMSEYGGRFEMARIDHVGAVLRLVVHTRGDS